MGRAPPHKPRISKPNLNATLGETLSRLSDPHPHKSPPPTITCSGIRDVQKKHVSERNVEVDAPVIAELQHLSDILGTITNAAGVLGYVMW